MTNYFISFCMTSLNIEILHNDAPGRSTLFGKTRKIKQHTKSYVLVQNDEFLKFLKRTLSTNTVQNWGLTVLTHAHCIPFPVSTKILWFFSGRSTYYGIVDMLIALLVNLNINLYNIFKNNPMHVEAVLFVVNYLYNISFSNLQNILYKVHYLQTILLEIVYLWHF